MLLSAIIFVNDDLTISVQDTLMTQLFISEAITGDEFDARVLSDPEYPHIIHINGLRILVIRSFRHRHNFHLANVIIFIKAGLASIESNQCGPCSEPGHTLQVAYLTVNKLLEHYPPTLCFNRLCDRNVQNNIFYPLFPDAKCPAIFPFGSDKNPRVDTIFWTIPGEPFHAKGALIPRSPCDAPDCFPNCNGCCDNCRKDEK
jgi:hypothetical protein